MFRRVAALAAAALVLTIPVAATPAEAATKPPKGAQKVKVVSVTDGDTIRVRYKGKSTPVRLIGLNAPEMKPRQCYGPQSTTRMKKLTKGGYVWIKSDGTQGNKDRYGRLLRHIYTSKGTSLAVAQIRDGYAREYTYNKKYRGQATHKKAQKTAKAKKRGLWRACAKPTPVKAKPTPKPKPKPTSSCKIKGNISSGGKIYHLPGQRHYTVTKIDTKKGERWFCTEKQARNAGWRKAKV